jgi:Beta/Gamma crystallin
MKGTLKALLVSAGLVLAGNAAAQVTLFQDDGFQGHRFRANGPVENFADRGFNDEASSAEVRGGAWQVCTDANFHGRCVVLRPGSYPSLGSLGLNDKISSIRPLEQYGRADERGWEGDRHADRPWDYRNDDRYDRRYDERYDRDQYRER